MVAESGISDGIWDGILDGIWDGILDGISFLAPSKISTADAYSDRPRTRRRCVLGRKVGDDRGRSRVTGNEDCELVKNSKRAILTYRRGPRPSPGRGLLKSTPNRLGVDC